MLHLPALPLEDLPSEVAEERAHKLKLVIDRLWPPPDGQRPAAAAYPTVDVGPRTVRVQMTVGPIAPESRGIAFDEPLRLGIREAGAGNVVPISFTLYGGSVRAPISGALRIHIDEP